MADPEIEIVENPAAGDTGGAIIRLNGQWLFPPGAVFRIDPVDASAGDREGWPSGDLKPRTTRIGRRGVELLVGPEVIHAPALRGEVPVSFTVPALGLRSVVTWPGPSVAKPAKPSPQLAELALAEQSRAAGTLQSRLHRPASAASPASAAAVAAARVVAARRTTSASLEASGNGARTTHPKLALSTLSVDRTMPRDPGAMGEGRVNGVASRTDGPGPADPASMLTDDIKLPKLPALRHGDGSIARSRQPETAAALRRLKSYEVNASHTNPADRGRGRVAGRLSGLLMAFVLGGFVASVASALVLAPDRLGVDRWPRVASALAAVGVTGRADTELMRLGAIMALPERSPNGVSAEGVELGEALRRADANLFGSGDRDRDEARYWLRRALALGLGDQGLTWAMTQLGTLYASPPNGRNDLASARLLWEMAAAKGSPWALCFLGQLHERGLGTLPNAKRALDHYRKAKASGGCAGVDDAIARVRGKAS